MIKHHTNKGFMKKASEQVLSLIKQKILSGDWSEGSKIDTEQELCNKTGVSRTSVREAVESLVALGILTKKQGGGTYVNRLDGSLLLQDFSSALFLNDYDAVSVLEFREIIEPACVRLLIENYDKDVCAKLQSDIHLMEEHEGEVISKEFAEADFDFHMTITDGSKNQFVHKIMKIMYSLFARYQYESNSVIGPKSGVEEHKMIFQAIEQRDAEMASLLLKRHIQRSKRDLLASLSNEV